VQFHVSFRLSNNSNTAHSKQAAGALSINFFAFHYLQKKLSTISITMHEMWKKRLACAVRTGVEPDSGPPASRPRGSGKEHQSLVHQSAKDQSHLPHSQHVQPGRHSEMSDQRVLVPRQ